ncbi:hypothetical protein [Nonomuraea rubra]|uniref:Uncharacterized protein n=1 Tax=Nonomuraea rubra TaxID=46180 RepID=A0A7X0NXM9_9ACTN|nr:hypothetical protein [Nonomuraea rubra]MBB6551528.1 hypothetical protein [Nonomuraea rubra]
MPALNISEEAVRLGRELTGLNRDAYLSSYAHTLAAGRKEIGRPVHETGSHSSPAACNG